MIAALSDESAAILLALARGQITRQELREAVLLQALAARPVPLGLWRAARRP